ncbi:LIM domain protein, partial [Caligus rogercresseyi]
WTYVVRMPRSFVTCLTRVRFRRPSSPMTSPPLKRTKNWNRCAKRSGSNWTSSSKWRKGNWRKSPQNQNSSWGKLN